MHTALQRNPRWNHSSQAERDMYGADGRWLRRGAAEGIVGCDRAACYSGRVSRTFAFAEGFVPDKVPGAVMHEPRGRNEQKW